MKTKTLLLLNHRKTLSILSVLFFVGALPDNCSGWQQNDSDREKEWSDVSAIVEQYKGVFEEPPLTANLESDRTTAEAPILGNGGLGVIVAGSEDFLNLYLTHSQYWAGAPVQLGGIRITGPEQGNGNTTYRAVQDIAKAEVRSALRFNGFPLQVRCFLAPNESTLITELQAIDPIASFTFDVESWCRENPTGSGRKDGAVWVSSQTSFKEAKGEGRERRGPQPSCSGAIVATFVGGKILPAAPNSASLPKMRVSLAAGEKACVVTHVDAGREKKDCVQTALAWIQSVGQENIQEWDDQRAAWWKDYWLRSYVHLPDRGMEEYYYASLYLIGSAFREGYFPPSMYGPWVGGPGPTWGGYVLDYNFAKNHIAQITANRPEQDNFYQVLADLIPAAREKARSVGKVDDIPTPNGFPGILMGFNCGPFGNMLVYNEACIRSNAALNAIPFIRRYDYTLDRGFLEKYAYPYLKEAAIFYAAYVKKDESGRYIVPDSHGREAFPIDPKSDNASLDLLLVPPVWERAIAYSKILNVDADLRADWQEKLDNFSSVATFEQDGKIVISPQEGGRRELAPMDNPCALFGLFPGHMGGREDLWRNSVQAKFAWYNHNGFGLYQSQAVVAGWDADDLHEKFCKSIHGFRRVNLTYWAHLHCLEFVSGVGSINMMMLGCRQEMEFFPVWPANRPAAFTRLRARGAFLVDGRIEDNVVQLARIFSEKGAPCVVRNPWPGTSLEVKCEGVLVPSKKTGEVYHFPTVAGQTYVLSPREGLPPGREIKPISNLAQGKPARQSSTPNTGMTMLALAEIEVYGQDTTVNLAQGGTPTQSSTRNGCSAGKAIDGSAEGTLEAKSVACTEEESEPWWELDLGDNRWIRDIRVVPLVENGKSAFSDFTLSILDENRVEIWSRFSEKCVSESSNKKKEERKLLNEKTFRTTSEAVGAQGLKGRYVRVQLKTVGQPGLALDGGTSGWFDDHSVTLTQEEATPWWQVDLLKEQRIGKITIQNRGDYLRFDKSVVERLKDFTVTLLDEKGAVTWKAFCPYTPLDRVTLDAQGAKGRFVKVQKSVPETDSKKKNPKKDAVSSSRLNLSEVVVEEYTGTKNTPTNVARGKKTHQSSTDGSCDAGRAVDGNSEGTFSAGSVAKTGKQDNPWWEVDLGGVHNIERIRLVNRTDADTTVLRNFRVEVLDRDRKVVWQKFWRNYPNPYLDFYPKGTAGKYVRITLAYKQSLSLAEVEVYGEKMHGTK